MAYTIAEILDSRKVREGLILASVALLGVVSFGLGRLSAGTTVPGVLLCDSTPPAITAAKPTEETGTTAAAAQALSPDIPSSAPSDSAPAPAAQGSYVASKSGSVYHLPWCSGAKRIKEGNKVWFASKEEAEAAGYRPAANCKGL